MGTKTPLLWRFKSIQGQVQGVPACQGKCHSPQPATPSHTTCLRRGCSVCSCLCVCIMGIHKIPQPGTCPDLNSDVLSPAACLEFATFCPLASSLSPAHYLGLMSELAPLGCGGGACAWGMHTQRGAGADSMSFWGQARGKEKGYGLPPHHLQKAADALGVLCPEHMPHDADLAARRPQPLPIQARQDICERMDHSGSAPQKAEVDLCKQSLFSPLPPTLLYLWLRTHLSVPGARQAADPLRAPGR